MVVLSENSRFECHVVLGSVPVDQNEPLIKTDPEVLFVFAEGGVACKVGGEVDGAIVGELLESGASVPVYLDEVPISTSDAEELVVFCDVDVVPGIQLVGIADVGV